MSNQKMKISPQDFNINLKFYYMLKFIVKTSLAPKNITTFMNLCTLAKKDNVDFFTGKFEELIESKLPNKQKESMYSILDRIETFLDVKLFSLSLNLFIIKDYLLNEAKLTTAII